MRIVSRPKKENAPGKAGATDEPAPTVMSVEGDTVIGAHVLVNPFVAGNGITMKLLICVRTNAPKR